jgi:hypothetical protein
MAKCTARIAAKSSQKVSKASFRAIKKPAENAAMKNAKRPSNAATLTGREARREERFRDLVAWYILQGVDEASAKRRAQDEMHDDPQKE